jgi:hypothetical protein
MNEVTEGDIEAFKVLNYIKAAILTASWIANACCNRSALSVLDEETEEDGGINQPS